MDSRQVRRPRPARRGLLRPRRDFVAETLSELTAAIQRSVFAEEYARRPGWLQALDPRVKLVTFLGFLLLCALTHRLEVLAALYALTLALAARSRIPLGFFVKRVWVFIPLFAGLVALPAITNWVTPGEPVVTLLRLPAGWSFVPSELAITVQGMRGAAFLVLRVASSVSFAVLLVLTTPWARLLKALAVLRFPSVGILILGMTYRYLFVFLQVVGDMFLARKSRTVGPTPPGEQRRWIADRLGYLVGRSYHLGHEAYLAMVSRGWSGQARVMDDGRLGWREAAWTGFALGVAALVALWEGTGR
ncbi:MAG: cobalt ECF transporter T component CbiQ [Anaerolineae bacterium]|nr:cobalt ECF transporter T component CbiQ [Anaerolineae bacterium]